MQHNHLRLLPHVATSATVDEEQVITIRVQLNPPTAAPPPEAEDLQWLTVEATCELLSLSESTVRELVHLGPACGGIASAYVGRAIRVPRADVRRWQRERLNEQREAG